MEFYTVFRQNRDKIKKFWWRQQKIMTSSKKNLLEFVPFMTEHIPAKFHHVSSSGSKVMEGGWNPPPPPPPSFQEPQKAQ